MNRSKNTSRCVVLVYRRPTNKLEMFLQGVSRCGEFTHCESFCPDLVFEGRVGCTFTNFSCHDMLQTRECVGLYTHKKTRHMYAMHKLNLSNEEFDLFVQWNKRQVANHCAYNYADLPMQIFPNCLSKQFVRDVNPNKQYEITRLYCAQAVVLALRYALSSQHPVSLALAHINTRLSTPDMIAKSLQDLWGEPRAMWLSL
jgi:hypothetical protein